MTRPEPKVVFFDAFPIFDPRPVFKLAGELFPNAGPALAEEWRIRQFEYTWLRTASHRYKDFWHVTEDALLFACAKLQLELTNDKKEQLLNKYLALPVWPDVAETLAKLRARGLKLAFLSNMTENMLRSSARGASIEQEFDEVISTDRNETYKPNPQAYALGLDVFKVQRHEAVFVAFAGWDAAGAKWFGYPTFWNNRLQSQHERLDVQADAQGATLAGLVSYLES
jgi:2-haloacid dehalogenase